VSCEASFTHPGRLKAKACSPLGGVEARRPEPRKYYSSPMRPPAPSQMQRHGSARGRLSRLLNPYSTPQTKPSRGPAGTETQEKPMTGRNADRQLFNRPALASWPSRPSRREEIVRVNRRPRPRLRRENRRFHETVLARLDRPRSWQPSIAMVCSSARPAAAIRPLCCARHARLATKGVSAFWFCAAIFVGYAMGAPV